MKEILQRVQEKANELSKASSCMSVDVQGLLPGMRFEVTHCGITEFQAKTKELAALITDLRAAIAAEGEPVDTGKLWSLFRSALDKGHDMWATADDQGLHYEMASALKDAKASEYADKAAALYTSPPAKAEGEPVAYAPNNDLRQAKEIADRYGQLDSMVDSRNLYWALGVALRYTAPPTAAPMCPTDIYDFAGWLTTRPGVLEVGSSCEAGPMAEAVGEYLKAFPERFK